MISRLSIVCPGCETPFLVRLGLGPSKMTRFYVPCPACRLPVRGRSHGDDLVSHRVEFDAEWFVGDDEPSLVVTIDPNVPARLGATALYDGLGAAPTMTLLHLAGDERADALFGCLNRGQQAAGELWPKARRLYEYYLEGDWTWFDKSGRELFGDDWRTVTTAHERATLAHQAVGLVLRPMLDEQSPASAEFLRRYLQKHTRALRTDAYVSFARLEAQSGRLPALQRRIFDVLDLFMRRFDSWHIGVLRRIVPEDRLPLLDDLRLCRDEFDVLRDLYQQGFETACEILRYPVAAQNTVKRSDPGDFGPDVPLILQRRRNPSGLVAFEKLSNFEQLQFVAQVPGWQGWTAMLNNRTRNAIGHGTARHDLRTGLVLSDTEPEGVPYLNVAGDVFGVFDALTVSLQVVRAVRVVSSPDFRSSPPLVLRR